MTTTDPTTGAPLSPDAVQRILFIASPVHIYSIPPLTSTKGHLATHWTSPNPHAPSRLIFTARLRILETALPPPPSSPSPPPTITTHILLEDPSTGHLFAAAPYTTPSACEPVIDSTRFFALRVVSGAQKATLGIGFEERSLAFDFNIALQEARKVQSLSLDATNPNAHTSSGTETKKLEPLLRDWSLKAGETIHVDVGRRGERQSLGGEEEEGLSADAEDRALFSIAPPPADGREGGLLLPPPGGRREGKAERRRSRTPERAAAAAAELGFDDGEFGEFQ